MKKKEDKQDKEQKDKNKEKDRNIFLDDAIDRNIYLFEDIDEKSSREFIKDMNDIMDIISLEKGKVADIFIHLNTPGGNVSDMFAIVDYIEYAKSRGFVVNIIGLGQVQSAGLVILSAGSKGHRMVGKNTRLMFHQVRSTMDGEMSTLRNDMKETEYCQEQYLTSLLKYSSKNRKFYDSLIRKNCNYYFSSNEAIEWGIADKIL